MADPQAEGGKSFAGNPPTDGPTNTFGSDPGTSNIVKSVDVTSIANDADNDHDYDDPYPGGATSTLGVPGDG